MNLEKPVTDHPDSGAEAPPTPPRAAASVAVRRRWPGDLLGLYAVAAGLVAMFSASVYPCGWGVFTRPLLGLIGLAGGLLLFLGDPWWKPLLRIWTFAQAVVVVVDASGELTGQPFWWFPDAPSLWIIQKTSWITWVTLNDQVIGARGYGGNVLGLLLFAFTWWIIGRKWYADVPKPGWPFIALRIVRSLLVVGAAVWVGLLAFRWAPLYVAADPLMVVLCPLPGADVYLEHRRLGSTPLVVTHDKMVAWGLSRTQGVHRCAVLRPSLGDGFSLQGNSGTKTLQLKPPFWCEKSFELARTEWGPRAVLINDLGTSNRHVFRLVAKAQPGFVLGLAEGGPGVTPPGQPMPFTVGLRCNPPDPRVPAPPPSPSATRAVLEIIWLSTTNQVKQEVILPAEWNNPAPGARLEHAFKVAAPAAPGKYDLRFTFGRYADAQSKQPIDPGWKRTYGFVEVR
jgi:hypothetical protein